MSKTAGKSLRPKGVIDVAGTLCCPCPPGPDLTLMKEEKCWAGQDSNLRPPACKEDKLPIINDFARDDDGLV